MRVKIKISPAFNDLYDVLVSLPSSFDDDSLSVVLHDGRNKIRHFKKYCKTTFVVKKFIRINFFNRLMYSFFRKSKAERSYENACKLIMKGVLTPEPIAYIERRKWLLLFDQYYICKYSSWNSMSEIFSNDPVEETKFIVDKCVNFIADMHKKGILHFDLNPANILYNIGDDGIVSFSLIDLNRMSFLKRPSIGLLLKNLTRMTENDHMYGYIVYKYIYSMGLKPYGTIIRCMFNKIRRNKNCKFKHEMRKLRKLGFTARKSS